MRANYPVASRAGVRRQVQREVRRVESDIYDAVVNDVAYQMLAVAMIVLHRDHGFGKKRLRRLKDAIEIECDMMEKGFLGREYTANDCVKWLKEHYGIDFAETIFTEKGKGI